MNKVLFGFSVLCLSFSSMAQLNGTLMGALSDSQEDIETTTVTTVKPTQLTQGQSMDSTASCDSIDQSSLPLSFVMGLLRGKGATLTPTHNPSTGELNIFGGEMIANCNSLLDFVFHPAVNGNPHSFETRIKSCGKANCEYQVQVLDGESISTETKSFAPNMDGFVSCLKETGVYDDGKINKAKIVKANFDVDKSGVTDTSELVFISKGPAFNNMKKVFSNKTIIKNDQCFFYEDIQSGGYKIYSKLDIGNQVLQDKAAKLCNEANYESIYQNLEAFTSLSGTYNQLEAIMKKDLLAKVAKAKIEFDAAVEKGDLSKLDTKKYSDLFDAFYKLIVQKHFDSSAHNTADETSEDLLINLQAKIDAASTPEEKERLEKKMRDISAELARYMQDPYFSSADYAQFLSMKKKAPIKDPLWKRATLNMHKSVISLKAACQAYSVDNSSCKFSKDIDDMMPVEELNDVIADYREIAYDQYTKRESVLKNPDEDKSEFYAEKLAQCEALYSRKSQGDQVWMQVKGQVYQSVMGQCAQKNPYAQQYGGRYMTKLQECVEDEMLNAESQYTVSSQKIEICNAEIDLYKSKYSEWAKLEGYRDDYYAKKSSKTPEVAVKTPASPAAQLPMRYTPSMNPMMQNQQMQNPMMNQSYSQYSQQQGGLSNQFASPMMNQNNYSMNPYMMNNQFQQQGFNGGMGMNNPYQQQGFNSGMGMNLGLNVGGGFNQGRFPSYNQSQGYGNPYSQFGGGYTGGFGGGQGYPGPMNNYMGNQTSPMGGYNFFR